MKNYSWNAFSFSSSSPLSLSFCSLSNMEFKFHCAQHPTRRDRSSINRDLFGYFSPALLIRTMISLERAFSEWIRVSKEIIYCSSFSAHFIDVTRCRRDARGTYCSRPFNVVIFVKLQYWDMPIGATAWFFNGDSLFATYFLGYKCSISPHLSPFLRSFSALIFSNSGLKSIFPSWMFFSSFLWRSIATFWQSELVIEKVDPPVNGIWWKSSAVHLVPIFVIWQAAKLMINRCCINFVGKTGNGF